MESIFIIIGILISITSLFFVFFSKEKKLSSKRKDDDSYNEIELEYRDLRNDIRELMKEFNRSATFNTNLLDEKTAYIKEIRDDIEAKEFKITKLMTDMEIMYNRLRKLVEEVEEKYKKELYTNTDFIIKEEEKPEEKVIKMIPKQQPQNGKKGFNDIEEEIIEYYRQGMTIREISSKTGRSLGEIEFIMGLRKSQP